MTREHAERFAADWIRHWSHREVQQIVSHFAPDARFTSPVAAKRTGHPLVTGREALRDYWSVVHTFTTFQFFLERTIWDDAKQELVIVYTREIDGKRDRACEILRFDSTGLVYEGEAMYGASLE
ncbi:MAG: nuclear transport factor 2 family protein [Acidobacteria bacterium]|nr:nuclear transport factor 2 family protein [Acidobacteriota bacterium]